MNCEYLFDPSKQFIEGTFKTFDSYKDLVKYFYELPVSKRNSIELGDFLYRMNMLDATVQRLEIIKKEYNPTMIKDSGLLGEDGLTTSEVDNKKVYTTQTFIDSDYFCDENGKRLVPYIDRANFINHIIASTKDLFGGNEDLAREHAEGIVSNWDKICEDSKLMHYLLTKHYNFPSDLDPDLKGTRLEGKADLLIEKLGKARKYCFYNIGDGKSNEVVRNLNLKCKLYGIDAEIIGHIDNIIVDPSGGLHIINYRVSSSINHKEKEKKLRYQMALLKQMLAELGFNTKYITLEIVPIFIKYSDDFSSIENVEVYNKESLTIDKENGRYIFQKFENDAERFIKGKIELLTPSDEEVNSSNKFLRALFDLKEVTSDGIKLSADEWIRKNINHRIVEVTDEPGVCYKIIFSSTDVVKIKDFHKPKNNEEIKKEVISRLLNLDLGHHEYTAHNIVDYLKQQ